MNSAKGKILCCWLDTEGMFCTYTLSPSNQVSLYKSTLDTCAFTNTTHYNKEDLEKATAWCEIAREGVVTVFKDCDNCEIRFKCFTNKELVVGHSF